MKPSLYLETTIPSFLVGNFSPVLVTAAHQLATRQWWEEKRDQYRLYVSPIVIRELEKGKRELSQQRIQLVSDIARLEATTEVVRLAVRLQQRLALPRAAETDALHVAIACHYAIDYLLTWNLRHIANGRVMRALNEFHDETNIRIPTICTPDEILDRNDAL
jgi:predicted nucleic acid-binding protein